MLHELQALTAARSGNNATMNVGAGVLGSRILQILEVISSIVVPPPPKRTPYSVRLLDSFFSPPELQGWVTSLLKHNCRILGCCL